MAISKLAAPPTSVPDWLLHDPTKHCLNAPKEREKRKQHSSLISSNPPSLHLYTPPFLSHSSSFSQFPSSSHTTHHSISISNYFLILRFQQILYIFCNKTKPNQSKATFSRQEFSLSLSPFLTLLTIYSCVWVYHAE